MAEFIIAYIGGDKPETPEQGMEGMKKWQAWLGDLGDAVVNPGTPLGEGKIVSADGVEDRAPADKLTGYTVVEAENLDAAIVMAKACPFLETNGRLEVRQMMKMP